jgi:hypothetical protein
MFSSLVTQHGSTSHSENMNMNAFKKTLVAIAAVATLGATGLVSTQASAGPYITMPHFPPSYQPSPWGYRYQHWARQPSYASSYGDYGHHSHGYGHRSW